MSTNENSKTKTPAELQAEIEKHFNDSYENLKQKNNRRLADIPCYRSTLLTSTPVGIITGLFAYLLTSKWKYCTHSAVVTTGIVSLAYYQLCHNEFDKKMKQNAEAREIFELITRYRGTEMEGKLQEKYKEKISEMDTKSRFF